MIHTICLCAFCEHRRVRAPAEHESLRRAVGEGPFGARPPGSRSRYREHISEDYFNGRRPGGHAAPLMARMPRPHPIEQARGERLLVALRPYVERARVPFRKIGDVEQFRQDLSSHAVIELLASEGETDDNLRNAVERAQHRLRRIYREVAFEAPAYERSDP